MKTQSRVPVPGQRISVDEQQRLAVDGMLPSTIMRPASVEQAAHELRLCAEAGASVLVIGGQTQISLGVPPTSYDVAFLTPNLSSLLEYEPADLTCRAEAGMRVGDLQATLAEHGQRLPLYPPHPDRATLGGMVAANTSGIARARYGTVRDWVIGIAVAYPNGVVARAGGKVVKNVAGYDLMKLHTGALGTLGVIVELNFKVQTVPETQAMMFGQFEDFASAFDVGRQLGARYLGPAASALLDRAALRDCGLIADWRWTLALKLEGYRREVEVARSETAAAIRGGGGRVEMQEAPGVFWDAVRDWSAPEDVQTVALYGMSSLNGLKAMVEKIGSDGQVIVQPAAGVMHARVPRSVAVEVLSRVRQAAGDGGQVIVSSAPAALKKELDIWGPLPSGFALMLGLKGALDPTSTLNPGRFVGGI